MSKNETNAILVVNDVDMIQQLIVDVLELQKYRVIKAANGNEARLKFSNEPFKMIIMDMDIKGFSAKDFIESIRRKEEHKNVKDLMPILVTGGDASIFQRDYSGFDNVKFLENPFSEMDLKKKLLSFTEHASVISENSKIIKKDDYLLTEGGDGKEMFWVLAGSFVITKMNSDEQNVIIGKVSPGELVGEMSFLDSMPRSASVRASEDSEVLVIPHKKFIDTVDGQPRWFRSLMQTLSQRLRDSNQKVARKVVDVDDVDDKQKVI
jgi:CRP/FNR family cyclic AMP-dependent transcriptional regulator